MILEEPPSGLHAFRCPLMAGSSCVLSEEEGKNLVFYSLDPVRGKGAQLGKIEATMGSAHFYDWAVSADGSRLAVVDPVYKDYSGRIEVLTLSDRAWHEVFVEPGWGDLWSVAWAADGKGFFVTSDSPDSLNLLRVTLAGKVNLLLRFARSEWLGSPLPSPDGKYLAFRTLRRDSNVWMIENF